MTAPTVPKSIAALGERDVEDRFQHMQQRRLQHPISNAGNPQRPQFLAARLGYPDALDRAGPILSRPQFLLQPTQFFGLAVPESLDGLVIDSGRPLVAQHRLACRSEIQRMVDLVNQRVPLSSAHSVSERVQHALVPHDAVRPLLDGWGLSGGGSPEGHCRQSLVRSFGTHAFISLRPFAPPALPGFDATMDALTPAHRSVPEVASAVSCLSRCPMRHRSPGRLCVVAQTTISSSRDGLSWTGIPASFAAPSIHSASNHPLPSRCDVWVLQHQAYRRTHRFRCARVLGPSVLGFAIHKQGFTTATGRIEFVSEDRSPPVLRTGRSPRIAPHPASRRRSYLRLRGTRHPSTRTFTSPMQQHHRRTRVTPSA